MLCNRPRTSQLRVFCLVFGGVFLGKVRNVDAAQFNLDVKQSASLQK